MIKVDLVAAMGCSKCGRPGVIFQEYSGLRLCSQHFKEDLLHKAKKTVRQNHWLVPGTRYAVALSGGPKSSALLDFMHSMVGARKDIHLIALTIKNNDPGHMENAKAITGSSGIPWFEIPDNNVKIQTGNLSDAVNKCSFKTHLSIEAKLTLMAEELDFDALVTGYSLEDHAEWVLWNAISGNKTKNAGDVDGARMRPKITRPFMHIPGKELDLYTRLFLKDYHGNTHSETDNHEVDPVSTILAQFYRRHPGVPYALVNIGEQIQKFRDHCS
jgi:tRNA(Ile)-lysidine synthase TilS/MesJ